MSRNVIPSAGRVRTDGRDLMKVTTLAPRYPRWGLRVSGFFLALALVVPHAGLGVSSVYAFAVAASLVAMEFAWTHAPQDVRAECIALGLAAAALFLGLAGSGVPNAILGPVLLVAAVGLSWLAWRAYPPRGHGPSVGARAAAFLLLAASMWAAIMLVRTLQRWPPWS